MISDFRLAKYSNTEKRRAKDFATQNELNLNLLFETAANLKYGLGAGYFSAKGNAT